MNPDRRPPPRRPSRTPEFVALKVGAGEPSFQSPWVQVRSRSEHPFIYRGQVLLVDPRARSGDVVQLYDREARPVGTAIFNDRSQITLRMLSAENRTIDDAFWRERIRSALELRKQVQVDEATDAFRIIHAEGDDLSGLIVERYANTLVFELFSAGMALRWRELAKLIEAELGPARSLDRPQDAPGPWRALARMDERVAELEGFDARRLREKDEAPTVVTIREHDVRYRVDVTHGHKTGFFCDQRENRRKFASLCAGARVLDLCCYTGGFSLCARKLGGASDVTAVDLDEKALALARENANLNQTRIQFVHSDAFNYLRQLRTNQVQFDAIVLDPPKLARSRADLEDALVRYNDLNTLALHLVRPGGVLLTCSCSGVVSGEKFLETVQSAGRRAARKLQLFDRTGAAPDHPVALHCPETEYLKALWLRVQ